MNSEIAFIGDVHGNVQAMRALIDRLRLLEVARFVFLGDYLNKGPDSRLVVESLMVLSTEYEVVALKGNHEQVFLESLSTGDVRPLLRMSGAPTVRSYVGGDVDPDVAQALRAAVPSSHIGFLKSLPNEAIVDGVLASHEPSERAGLFAISAHMPVGPLPEVSDGAAKIDTGCGTDGGRLTALLWPSLAVVQVDQAGNDVFE